MSTSYGSFFPSSTRLWNSLPVNVHNATSINIFKSKVRGQNSFNPYHMSCSGKYGSWLTRLRLGLSALNAHRFLFNFIDSPICPYCYQGDETTTHYLFNCQSHVIARNIMFNRLGDELGIDTLNQEMLLKTILEGEAINKRNFNSLLNIIYEFMKQTKRFT